MLTPVLPPREPSIAPPDPPAPPRTFRVLGVDVHAVQIPGVVAIMEGWIRMGEPGRYIAVTGMHGISVAGDDEGFRRALRDASLVVPDGMPLVWIGRARGHALARRVYGPELMLEFCRLTAHRGYRHFFYGGGPGVAEELARVLRAENPRLVVAGTAAPPFRDQTEQEIAADLETINAAAPDVVWIGLGTPRQERWMRTACARLRAHVLVGVGAAFDINSGRVRQAPSWMREHGLEWSWRLLLEPRRLWRRYLLNGPSFACNALLELSGLRRFD